MQRAMMAMCVSGLFLLSSSAAASEASGTAALQRQQISDCMSKKMGANKTLSYNDAMRACKDLLQPTKETIASNTAAPAGKSH
jgi:hypothetical protein